MKKDIFIDNNIATKFAGTTNVHYQEIANWLMETPDAYLVISESLRKEYFRSNEHCNKSFSIISIYHTLIAAGRLISKSKQEIELFKNKYFDKKVWRGLRCKRKGSDDPSHMALVYLSDRRMALSDDINFIFDLQNFPRFGSKVTAASWPSNLDYK